MQGPVINKKFSLRDLLKIAAAASLSAILMITVRLPLILSAPFLTYDFSEVPALLMGLLMGPAAGILTVLIKDAVFLLFHFSPLELMGIPADLAAGFTLVGVASDIYNSGKGEGEKDKRQVDYKRLFWASSAGIVCMTAIMAPVNILLYRLMSFFFADFLQDMPLWQYVVGAALPFNFLKGCLTCLIVSAACGRLFFLKKNFC